MPTIYKSFKESHSSSYRVPRKCNWLLKKYVHLFIILLICKQKALNPYLSIFDLPIVTLFGCKHCGYNISIRSIRNNKRIGKRIIKGVSLLMSQVLAGLCKCLLCYSPLLLKLFRAVPKAWKLLVYCPLQQSKLFLG